MLYSYVMGVDDSILELREQGFKIETSGGDYLVAFSEEKASVWEKFIKEHLELEYWNEYLAEDNKLVFMFQLKDGLLCREIENFEDDAELLVLCEQLAECKFESVKKMVSDNAFYGGILAKRGE